MSLNEKEKAIREKRTIEAVRKNFMGVAGKIGLIVKYLGKPIKHQGGGFANVRTMNEYLGDVYGQEYNQDEIFTFDENDNFIENIGYIFDGLSRGIHMEIKYLDEVKTLTVHWKGYPVYREVAGDLYTYAPFDEWEDKINSLYQQAEKLAIKDRKLQKAIEEKEVQQKQLNFLKKLRMRWGI